MPASEDCIQQFSNHDPPSIPERCMSSPWVVLRVLAPPQQRLPALKYLDSLIAKRVELFAKRRTIPVNDGETLNLDIVTGGGKTFHTGDGKPKDG